MDTEPTHILFDGKKVVISENLGEVFDFLQKIEEEVESLLNMETKLKEIRKQYLETVELVQVMAKVIKDNNLDFKYTFTEPPETIGKKLEHHYTTRAEMIVLFANLETLMCLYVAYENDTEDENQIRKLLMDSKNIKIYINQFLLSVNNPYYRDNQAQFKYITSRNVRELRNSLAHFFSVRGFALAPEALKDEARSIELMIPSAVTFISPQETYKLIQGGALLMLKKWDSEYKNNPDEFGRKIKKVKSIVERDGAKIVYQKDFKSLNIKTNS